MSSLRHPHLELWARDEHGGYRAEIDGWQLSVKWRTESEGKRRGFWFEASWPGGATTVSDAIHEEMELAMSSAEYFASLDA